MAESLDTKDVFSYITTESNNWKTVRVPLTNSKDWNMYEHIQRCTNVANAWYHKGQNDGLRPYNDIVTPIIDVAFRSEGFDVKDITPYVNDAQYYYKSFLVKKYHPRWARKNQLDTFIDEVVETSIIYDLVLIKDVNETRPEVVDLKTIAFCDQTDVMAGPICIEHNYTIAEISEKSKKWDKEAVDMAITMAVEKKNVSIANDQDAKTPSKYVKVYELRGNLPEKWLDAEAERHSYTPQMHLVCFYTDKDGNKQGLTLYKGKDKPLQDVFKALKIDTVRSKGRACGRSVVERLFDPQVWNNYSAIKIKEMLDAAVDVLVSDSEDLGGQKLSELKTNTVLKVEKNSTTTRLNGSLQNLPHFQNYQTAQQNSARELGSASDLALGNNPTSGTPLGTTEIVHVEGQGIHVYRQGKIATFFADVLYPDLILKYLVKDINAGKKFSEELSLDELQEIADQITGNEVEKKKKEMLLKGVIMTPEESQAFFDTYKEVFMKGGNRRFFEILEGELKEIPLDVFVNIKGKQRYMAENADKITNIIREVLANPQGFAQVPGIGKAFNELLEESGMSAIDFSGITKLQPQPEQAVA